MKGPAWSTGFSPPCEDRLKPALRTQVRSVVADPLFDPTFLKKLEMLTLVARQLFRGDTRGDRRSTVHGASVEFADFRPYVQGDDFRRIDWNAYAKFESLMLRLFVEEQELAVHILLDCSESMNYGSGGAQSAIRQQV